MPKFPGKLLFLYFSKKLSPYKSITYLLTRREQEKFTMKFRQDKGGGYIENIFQKFTKIFALKRATLLISGQN